MENEELIEISGTVEGIAFQNAQTGFTVLDISQDGELITAVGIMPGTAPGEEVKLTGRWDIHRSYGRQFSVSVCERSMPATEGAVLRYLSSGAIKGIGPAMAARIVKRFGSDTLKILETEPLKLAEIKGISENKALNMSLEYQNQFGAREIMLRLSSYGITPDEALAVFRRYGSAACDKILADPYLLCADFAGFDFARADNIAAALGNIAPALRNRAGVLHVLYHNTGNGHTCLPYRKLNDTAAAMLDCSQDEADIACDDLIGDKRVYLKRIQGVEYVFPPHLYNAEKYIATRMDVMLRFPAQKYPALADDIAAAEKQNGIKYEDKQRFAIKSALENGLLVLTGGPGTGKTTTLNAIIELLEKYNQKVLLAAPTGRAAKRMNEVCGREAKTLHRLLEVEWTEDGQVFSRNEQNPLDCSAVIVDEFSMVDAVLFESLLRAMPLSCRLILVGDCDQLPSIGAGRVLFDLIESDRLPVVQLTEVFRQARQSLIVTNAHRIVAGEMPIIDAKDNDFFMLCGKNPVAVARTVVSLCCDRLPAGYGLDPMNDIQVLCPGRKRQLGTFNVNAMLQQRLNPPDGEKRELSQFGYTLREGDKVMQIRNNYNISYTCDSGEIGAGVFNGDIGILKKIDGVSKSMTVRFDDRTAVYNAEDIKDLELAYAVTVHKSQGSEYECVVIPILDIARPLCYRNLLYTAVTRARRLLILVGDPQLLSTMAANDRKTLRYTGLCAMLRGEVE